LTEAEGKVFSKTGRIFRAYMRRLEV